MMKLFLIFGFFFAIFLSFEGFASESKHNVDFGLHLRAAEVDVDDKISRAASAKLRVTWGASWTDTLSSTLELDHVSTALKDQHDDGLRGNGEAQIPDVAGSEINQGFIQLNLSQWKLRAGRQRLEYDNQRFIGSNSFWQNDQTFDALRIDYDFFNASTFSYAYVGNVNRIFGDDARRELSISDVNYDPIEDGETQLLLGDHKHNTHLFNLRLKEWDYSFLGFYYYNIDNRNTVLASNNTLGARFNYQRGLGSFDLRSDIEIATQSHPELSQDQRTNYHLIELAASLHSTEVEIRQEVLGGKEGVRFVTPLASLHNFQGWVDKFSSQPTNGIVDNSLALSWRRSPFKIDVRFHKFNSKQSDIDWGKEVDIDLIFKVKRKHRFLVRYANFISAAQSRALFPSETRIFFSYSYNM